MGITRKIGKHRLFTALLLVAAAVPASVYAARRLVTVGVQPDGSIVVPTGQTLTPPGTTIDVNDRPLGMVVSPDGTKLAVVTGSNFAPRALHIIDMPSKTLKQTIAIGDSFVGVDFSPAGDRIYVGGNTRNNVAVFALAADGTFAASGTISIASSAPSGLKVNRDGSKVYVALNTSHQLGIIDTATGAVTRVAVGIHPYTTAISADGSKVYVSNWGGRVPGPGDVTDGMNPVVVDPRTGIPATGTVSVVDTASNTVIKSIDTGLHPTGMALSPSGDRLYVTCANSDTVSAIDTVTDQVVQTLRVGVLGPDRTPVLGSSPNAVAVSPDGATLYVANASQNAVAVVDLRGRRADDPVAGFIPTGWYPTAVALDHAGQQLFIASGYGFGSIAPTPPGRTGRSYTDRAGEVSILPVPSRHDLAQMTKQVFANNQSPTGGQNRGGDQGDHGDQDGDNQGGDDARNPIPMNVGQRSPIKHVFYIIKENRTYDQVFGDLPQGNGDPTLVQFGRNVSPNHHALAEQFVLLDNYYGPGDQSALGHRWILQAFPSTYVYKYGNARNNQSPMLLGPTDAVYDSAKAHGVSVRAYGERGLNTITPAGSTWTDMFNDWKNGTHNVTISAQAVILGLRDIYHPSYGAAESAIPDVARADIFLQEFHQFEQNGQLPSLVLLLLYNDHTAGTSPGFPTPRAQVADNDLALGKIVDAISHSRFWKESAIFVTEDDSQDGLDHVDGHRTVGLVISPYTRRNAVNSTFYSIINVFRTVEQILGLPPQNQYALAAQPMFDVFTSKPDFTPYTVLPNNIPLDEMNPAMAGLKGLQRKMAKFSLAIDKSSPDSADADTLNRAIWHSVKGWGTPYNYGRPVRHGDESFLTLPRLAAGN
jgi:YVTN family beta-propeller protein